VYWYLHSYNQPSGRIHPVFTCSSNTKGILFGGLGAYYLNDLHVLDISSMTYSSPQQFGDIPSGRATSGVIVGSYLVIYGGYDGSSALSDVFKMDVNTYTWTRIQSSSLPIRFYHFMFLSSYLKSSHDGQISKIFIFGGTDNSMIMVDDDLTFQVESFEYEGNEPSFRTFFGASTLESQTLVFGGKKQDGIITDEMYLFKTGITPSQFTDSFKGAFSVIIILIGISLFATIGYGWVNRNRE